MKEGILWKQSLSLKVELAGQNGCLEKEHLERSRDIDTAIFKSYCLILGSLLLVWNSCLDLKKKKMYILPVNLGFEFLSSNFK